MGAAVSAQTADETTNTTDDSETNSTIEFDYDAELANDTVTVSVTANNSAVENASVAVNDTAVGETDTNGTVDFALGNRSAVELGVTVEDTTQTRSYAVEDGTLVEQSEEAELPEAAPEKVSTIQRLIDAFRSGEFDKLGPAISDAVSNDGNADRADNASEQSDEPGPPADAGNAPDDAGPPEDVGKPLTMLGHQKIPVTHPTTPATPTGRTRATDRLLRVAVTAPTATLVTLMRATTLTRPTTQTAATILTTPTTAMTTKGLPPTGQTGTGMGTACSRPLG